MARVTSLWYRLGPIARAAAGALALALIVVVSTSRSLIGALLTPSAGASETASSDEKQREDLYRKSFENHLAQINGRSMFFTPSPPRKAEGPRAPEPGPSAPTTYGGPALLGFANGAAYFADGRRLSPDSPGEGSLKLKSLNPPWSATVTWEGVEFTVTLFDRDKVVLSSKPADPPAAATPPAPAPSAPPAPPTPPAANSPPPNPEGTPPTAPPEPKNPSVP